MMSDLLDEQLSHVVRILHEEFPPITPEEIQATEIQVAGRRQMRRSAGPLVAAGVLVLVLVLFGGLWLFGLEPSDPPVISSPTTSPPTTQPSTAPQEWSSATGIQLRRLSGEAPIVSNGSSFLAISKTDEGNEVLVRSIDGVTWSEVDSPTLLGDLMGLTAVGDVYLMSQEEEDEDACGNGQVCPLWRSSDGLKWELVDSILDHPFDLVVLGTWRVQSHETILTTRPVRSNGMDGFYSVVMEFDDRLVQFRTEYPDDPSDSFVAVESTDGTTWSQIKLLPPFASLLTTEYLDAGWQWMWRCEVAVQNSQAMMLVSDDNQRNLWTSDDGITWRQLPNPPQPGTSARHQCIKAVDGGWILAPGGVNFLKPSVPGWERITGTPSDIYFSTDGISWEEISFPDELAGEEGVIEIAGNTIFIIGPETSDVVVGKIEQP